MPVLIETGDCRDVLQTMKAGTVQTCVTSPPYFGLRDYGVDGQIGLEESVEEYVAQLVAVFREVRRVLRHDGTLWLNLGDSYASTPTGSNTTKSGLGGGKSTQIEGGKRPNKVIDGLKPKDLIGIPWRVAFALQADGWWLRSDIIWHKPNPMPESVTDRPTKAHEYIFLLAKSERYYYDADAAAEPVTASTIARISQPNLENQRGSDRAVGKTNGTMKAVVRKQDALGKATYTGFNDRYFSKDSKTMRNRRTVWTVATTPFKGSHFATFPPDLIKPCIEAGSSVGDTVLDPFGGAGTTGLVSDRLGRNAVLIELNPEYAEMARQRISRDAPLFTKIG